MNIYTCNYIYRVSIYRF